MMWLANVIELNVFCVAPVFRCFVCLFQSELSGFNDPCPYQENMLRIRYLFREAVHEGTVGDNEPV